MYNFDVVTLRDGTPIDHSSYESCWKSLTKIAKEDEEAFLDLIERCHEAKDGIPTTCKSPQSLKDSYLVNEDETISPHVHKIVFNAISGTGYWTELVDPLQTKEIKPVLL